MDPKTKKKKVVRKSSAGRFRFRFKILLAEKELRDGRKYTYTDINKATGIATSNITKWAQGKVEYLDLSTLATFCVFFECKVSDLIEFIGD